MSESLFGFAQAVTSPGNWLFTIFSSKKINKHSDSQTLHDPPVLQVFIDDLVQVLPVQVGVPDIIRVHDQHRSLFTTIQAPRRIDSDTARTGDTKLLAALLDIIAHGRGIKTLAAGAAVGTQVRTEEDVVTIIRHGPNHTAEGSYVKAP